jgi:hypothetical protein
MITLSQEDLYPSKYVHTCFKVENAQFNAKKKEDEVISSIWKNRT